jgi:hypothetical protein
MGPYFFPYLSGYLPANSEGAPYSTALLVSHRLPQLSATGPRAASCGVLCPGGLTLPMLWPGCPPMDPDRQGGRLLGFPLDDRFTPNTGRSRGGDIGGYNVRCPIKRHSRPQFSTQKIQRMTPLLYYRGEYLTYMVGFYAILDSSTQQIPVI